ncbi:cytochrome [Hapalosiphon sp. MRB220]|nr:cytochrome [Hapalosiphon sp. MRB220]
MKLPPSLKTPAWLQMLHWIANPFTFLDSCAQAYGDCFCVRIGINFAPIVVVSNPITLQQIYTANPEQIDAPGEKNKLLGIAQGGENALVLASGVRHQCQRQLIMPSFHGERIRNYGQLIENITEQAICQWKIGKRFLVQDAMKTISLRIILSTVFGLEIDKPRYQQMEKLLISMLEMMSSSWQASMLFFPILQQDLGALSPWGRFRRCQKEIDRLLYAEIQERRNDFDLSRTDVLTSLIAARYETGEQMTDVELRDELVNLLIAGHETTATTLTWALYWIHKLPTVRKKLVQEINSLENQSDKSAILQLPYLNAVCSETLRMYPVGVVTFPRVVNSPLQLMDYYFPAGTDIYPCPYLTHQREDLYPEPKQFKPERFLERKFSPYEYLPFGGGSRRCIGMAFALFEMKVILAKILSRFQLALDNHHPVRPIRRTLLTGPSNVWLVPRSECKQISEKLNIDNLVITN